MSTTTTSASCLSATPRATVAPTLPAPPTTVTLRFICAPCQNDQRRARRVRRADFFCVLSELRVQRRVLHTRDDGVPELGGLQLGRTFHEAREVVGHALRSDSAVHPFHDEIGGLGPPEMSQHHL